MDWIYFRVWCLHLDLNDGSLPFHRRTNGSLPLETIGKPLLPMVFGPLIHHLATSRVRVAGPQKGKRGQVRSEEAELAITTSFLRRTLSTAGVRAQSKLLLSRLEVIGPVAGANAAAGRRSYALNLERRMANQRRADHLSRMQGKALLRRGHFKID